MVESPNTRPVQEWYKRDIGLQQKRSCMIAKKGISQLPPGAGMVETRYQSATEEIMHDCEERGDMGLVGTLSPNQHLAEIEIVIDAPLLRLDSDRGNVEVIVAAEIAHNMPATREIQLHSQWGKSVAALGRMRDKKRRKPSQRNEQSRVQPTHRAYKLTASDEIIQGNDTC
jgi:hypothetical protein